MCGGVNIDTSRFDRGVARIGDDLFGEERVVAKAPASGIVLAIHPGPIIPQGDVLIHIGLNPTQA